MATKKKMQKGGSGKPPYDMRNAYDKKVQTNLTNSVSKSKGPTGSDYVGPYSIQGTSGPVNETVSKVRDIIKSPVHPIPYQKNGGSTKKAYKTGGMVNANSKITASKSATGKVGGITKAVSKVAVKSTSPKGRVGGISKAPKKALPKAQLGAIVKMAKTVAKAPKYITTAQRDLKAAKIVKELDDARGGSAAVKNAVKAKEKADKAITLSKIAKAPGGKTVIGGTIVGGITAANKIGTSKPTSTKTSTSTSASKMLKSSIPKWMQNSLENKKRGGSKGKC